MSKTIKPNDFKLLYDACEEAQLRCELHKYGSGKKSELRIEIYKEDKKIEDEAVKRTEKPEAKAKILYKRMLDNGKFG